MEEITPHGTFFPIEHPRESVPGKLSFDLAKGGTLTFPTLVRDNDTFVSAWQPILSGQAPIMGSAGDNNYILLDREPTAIELRALGHSRYVADVGTILIDAVPEMMEHDSYVAFRFRFAQIEEWSQAAVDTLRYQSNQPYREMSDPFNHRNDVRSRSPTRSNEAVFSIVHRLDHEIGRDIVIRRTASILVRPNQSLTLAEVRDLCATLESLFSIILDTPAPLTDLRVFSFLPSAAVEPFDAEVKTSLGRGTQFHAERPFRSWNALVSIEDLGGAAQVAAWIDVAQCFGRVIRTLADDFEIPSGQHETKLLNVVRAAEALFSIQNEFAGKTSGIVKQIVVCFAVEAAEALDNLIPCIDCWSALLTQLRHDIAHGDPLSVADDSLVRALADSLYLALAVALLMPCGLAEAAKSKLREHSRTKDVSAALSGLCVCGA